MKVHKLSPVKTQLARLSAKVVPHAPGIYIMYRSNMGPPSYVGRDDYRLYDAIDNHRRAGVYKYFKFMRCNNPTDAFQWECMFWHKGQSTIDNSEANGGRHPKPPRGEYLSCPYPGCTHTFEQPAPEPVMESEPVAYDDAQDQEPLAEG